MGCLFSKNEQVRTLSNEDEPLPASAFSSRGVAHAWLQEIGLPQYAAAFEGAGFSDWDLLSCLTESDLDAITGHTGTVIAPGHRKKLLMASRQMGQSAAGMAGFSPLLGPSRRYSHTSNPGTGHNSRGGGLAAAASAALERRSGGRRPSGTASRVPSHHSHYGSPGHHSHPSQHYHAHQHSGQPRNATDDGMISGRQGRARPPLALLLASRNSSRNSLLNGGGGGGAAAGGGAMGHAIGYVASPTGTLNDAAVAGGGDDRLPRSGTSGTAAAAGDGSSDAWPPLDGRPSPAEPLSPHPAAAALAAAAAAAASGSPVPPRPRKRWSVNQQASRGALVNGSVGGGQPVSGSSYGWVEAEANGHAWTGAGAGGVRQPSATSAPNDSSLTSAARRVTSRDLDSLVVGAADPLYRANGARGPHSLAAGRQSERPYGNAADVVCVVPVSPQRVGGGVAAGGAVASPPGDAFHSQPHAASRILAPRSPLAQGHGAGAGPVTPLRPRGLAVSATQLDAADMPPSSPYHYPAGSVVAAASAGLSTPGRAAGGPSGSTRRGAAGAVDSTLFSWAVGAAPLSPTQPSRDPSNRSRAGHPPSAVTPSGDGSPEPSGLSPTPPGAAWALQPDTPTTTAVLKAHDDETAGGRSGVGGAAGAGNAGAAGGGSGGGGGGLPRFVRALAGWAVPGAGGAAAAAGGANRRRSGEHSQQQRRSTLADILPQSDTASPPPTLQQAPGRWPRSAGPESGAARRARLEANGGGAVGVAGIAGSGGDAGAGVPGSAVRAASPEGPTAKARAGEESAAPGSAATSAPRGGRSSSRQVLFPDPTPRGPWDQNSALCIQGRGYRPGQALADGGGSSQAGSSHAGSRGGTGAGDIEPGSSSVAAAAAAARGGGWPFVLPQLPQPASRLSNSGATSAVPSQPPALPTAAAVNGAGPPAKPHPHVAGNGEQLQPHALGPAPAAAVASPSSPFARLSPLPEGSSSHSRDAAGASTASMLLETMTAASDADVNSAAISRRAPPQHSSRPPGWRPSHGGSASEAAVGAGSGGGAAAIGGGGLGGVMIGGGEYSADLDTVSEELAAVLPGHKRPVPNRVQIVHVEPSTMTYEVAPYGHVWGRGGAAGGGAGTNSGMAAAAQWPAMPLQPPTRTRPTTPLGVMPPPASASQAGAAGAAADAPPAAGVTRIGLMELLPPEPPGHSRAAGHAHATPMHVESTLTADAGGGAARDAVAGPPRPTPGRQLDLEMLADQVSRIMGHLSHITGGDEPAGGGGGGDTVMVDGFSSAAGGGGAGGTPAYGRRAARGPSSSGAGDGEDGFTAQAGAGGGGDRSGRFGGRMQAMDRKRHELQELHRDLVTRVSALAAAPLPPAPQHGPSHHHVGNAAGAGGAAGGDVGATEALAEVETRIRSKLAELAALTVGPQDIRDAAAEFGAAAAAAAGEILRKRSLVVAAAGAAAAERPQRQPGPAAAGGAEAWDAQRERRRAEEVALHEEVLAVLGARKRQARAGRRSSGTGDGADAHGDGADVHGDGGAAADVGGVQLAAGNGVGAVRGGAVPARSPIRQQQQQQQLPGRSPGQPPRSRGGSPLRARSGSGGEAGAALLAENHDALRAELLAIESKIRARVKENGGAAVARRA